MRKKNTPAAKTVAAFETGINAEANALSELYNQVKKDGVLTPDLSAQFIGQGFNILIAVAGYKNQAMSLAKADLMAELITFKDVEAAIAALGDDPFVGLSEVGSKIDPK